MASSLFATLDRRYGAGPIREERDARAQATQAAFESWLELSSLEGSCADALPNGVAVVGGGFAGMAAAWTLGEAGIASTVFEARSTYGGRVESDRSFVPGRIVEAGAELIGMNHPMWLMLAKRFGLGLIVLTGEDQYDGMGLSSPIRIGGKPVTDVRKLHGQLAFVLRKISEDAKAIVDPFRPWTTPGAAALDASSVADRIAKFVALLPAAIRHPLLVDALELQLGNDQVMPTRRQSYLALLSLVSGGRMGKADVDLGGYWAHHEDYRCAEGNDRLAGSLLEYGRHITFRPSSPVSGIEIDEAGQSVNVTWLDPTRGSRSKRFDHVILAVPPTVWKKIAITPALPPGNEMASGAAVKFMSRVPGRFWIRDGLAPGGLSDEIGQTWEATENQASATQGIVLTAFAGGAFVPKVDPVKRFRTGLRALYPSYQASAERYADWPSVPWIETGYVSPTVGQVTTIAKFLGAPYRKRLHFAGEHTCMAYYGYMEGALQSGAAAAKAIVGACRSARSTATPVATPARSATVGERLVELAEASVSSAPLRSAAMLSTLFDDDDGRPALGLAGHRPSATALFNAFVHGDLPHRPRAALQRRYLQHFEVLARPGDPLDDVGPCVGDVLVRVARGEGWGHVAVVASAGLHRHLRLGERGLRGEGYPLPLPGWHVHVVEAGARPRRADDRSTRRLADASGTVLGDTLLLRPLGESSDAGLAAEGDPPTAVLRLERLKVAGLPAIALTPTAGTRHEGFFATPIHAPGEPTGNVAIEVTGHIEIDTSGVRRKYVATSDAAQWPLAGATGSVSARIVDADGPAISSVPDGAVRSDGTFVFTAQLVVDGFTRSLTLFPKVRLKDGTKLSATIVVELVDLDGFLALVDPLEKARPASQTHLEFLASVRKLYQGGPTDPLAGAFDLTLYRNRKVPPLVAATAPAFGRFARYQPWLYADGAWLDIGHVLTGIEGSPRQQPSKDQSLPIPLRPELLVTWAGDLGSALQAYLKAFWHAMDTGDPVDLDDHLTKLASQSDLIGDIDGINLGTVYDGTLTLAQNLRGYYGAASRRRFHAFIANSKDGKGNAELPLVAASRPPRLGKPARDAIAAQVRAFLVPFWLTGRLYHGSEIAKRAIVDQVIDVASPEMTIVVDHFVRFLENGLARER